VQSRLLGRFNVSNLLAATAAAGALGVPLATIVRALENFESAPGRLEPVASKRGRVFVDYAHTESALENVLSTLRQLQPARLITVFGCGGDRDRTKRPRMAAAAARHSDYCILTSDNPRTEDPLAILREAAAGFPPGTAHHVQPDRGDAIGEAVDLLREGDILLIAGKGHETYQEIGRTKFPFDDREVAARNLRRVERG
jgi:UDP-N-acetylmuramoyl-L-alanyl-D-glutamate--2,6-diaminopimelate ligase